MYVNDVYMMDASTVQHLLSMEPLGTKASEEAKILTQSILSQISRNENREKFEEFPKTLISSLEQAMVVSANVIQPKERGSGQVHELPGMWSC